MIAELRSCSSLDVESLESWLPDDASFAIALRLVVGPAGSEGEELYELTVCSSDWIAARARETGIFDLRHHFVVERFDWPTIQKFLERRVRECGGADWNDVAQQLARLGRSEFEDYRR